MKWLTAVLPHQVTPAPGFWQKQLDLNAESILTLNVEHCERTGRFRNFAVCAGLVDGQHEGRRYNDSDVYKVLEGAAYVLADYPDHPCAQRVSEVIDWIAAAQQSDGYLNTYFTLAEPEKRWKDIRNGHELYCIGHLIEAALAWSERHGDDRLLQVSLKAIDHIQETFGSRDDQMPHPPGHQELELALIKLWQRTQNEAHLNMARFFLEGRGELTHRESYGAYCQDHVPVREQATPTGHAVRLMYQCCGQADLARALRDEEQLQCLLTLWDEMTGKHMYITGGIGSSALNEGFTEPYDLPNEIAYAETCAGIGVILWGQRMFLATGNATYHHVIERALYNAVLCGVSMDGSRFFYDNPLASDGSKHRVDWFDCSCCPSNLVRFLPQVQGLIYAVSDDDTLYVNQFVSSTTTCQVAGRDLTIEQRTSMPWAGRIELILGTSGPSIPFTLNLRQPDWCSARPQITVNDTPMSVEAGPDGYITVMREWSDGDRVLVDFPMEARFVEAPAAVRANRGRAAVERGPIVYCLEQVDLRGFDAVGCSDLHVDASARPQECRHEGLTTWFPEVGSRGPAPMALEIQVSGTFTERFRQPRPVAVVPYFMWDNRTQGGMAVWLRTGP
ncbi:MAG: glycoside hydrolase family 127 protein [Planctomycetes bacterium]|nr:glycoside hydrolase family 127 protein [Planctomycetota bacterium]